MTQAMSEATKAEEAAKAFGEGCDARLAGLPLSANPYRRGGKDAYRFVNWNLGWYDVHRNWPAKLLKAAAR